MSDTSIKAWHATTFFYEAMEALQRDNVQVAEQWLAKGVEAYPDNSSWPIAQASILERQHKYAEARDSFHMALNRPELTPEIQAFLWNNIAWVDLMIGGSTLMEEADQFSRQALEESPWHSYVKGTRGSVLIEMGRIADGVRLVEQAYKENGLASHKALNACYLAIAMLRKGNPARARGYIDEAKRRDPNCPLVERAVRELEQCPQPSGVDFH
jgi:Tfp pilus assembly protein PilF